MQQGKGLCFQSSSTQVSANDLGASTLLAESLRSFLDDLSRKIEGDSACGVGGEVACESIRFFQLKFFSFTHREKWRVKLETWAQKTGCSCRLGDKFSIIYLGNLEKLYFVARKYSVIRRTPSFEQILIKQAYFLVKNGASYKWINTVTGT